MTWRDSSVELRSSALQTGWALMRLAFRAANPGHRYCGDDAMLTLGDSRVNALRLKLCAAHQRQAGSVLCIP